MNGEDRAAQSSESMVGPAAIDIRLLSEDEMELPRLLVYAGSWVTITGGIWVLFERAETVASKEGKAAITKWLKNLAPESTLAGWPQGFSEIFDSVFGKRHFSVACFLKSCVASLLAVLALILLWSVLHPTAAKMMSASGRALWELKELLGLAVILNLIPDYFSLLKARYIIRVMSRKHSVFWTTLLLVVDLLASAAIYIAFFVVFWWSVVSWSRSPSVFLGDLLNFVQVSTDFRRPAFALLFATFFTSIWVWMYVLAAIVVKGTQYFRFTIRFIRTFLDIEEKPIRSLGVVSMLAVSLFYAVVPFLSN